MEVAVAKGGVRKGLRVATFVAQWTIAQAQLGHEPTVEEAADWWRESRTSWFRRQAEFREIFGLPTPAPFAAQGIAHVAERLDRRDLGRAIGELGRVVVA